MPYDKYHGGPFRRGDTRMVTEGLISIRLPSGDWMSAHGAYVWLCTQEGINTVTHTHLVDGTMTHMYIVRLQRKVRILPKHLRGTPASPMSKMGVHKGDHRPEVLRYILGRCIPYRDLAPLLVTTSSDYVRKLTLERLSAV